MEIIPSKNLELFKYPIILFAISIVVFMGLGLLLELDKYYLHLDFLFIDTYSYIEASRKLFLDAEPHFYRPFGIAFWHGLILLFNPSATLSEFIYFAVIQNIILWLLGIQIFYKTLSLLINKHLAFFGSLVYVFSISLVVHLYILSSENIFIFIVIVISYLLVKFINSAKPAFIIYSVSLINLLTLIRPSIFYFALLSSLILIGFLIYKKTVIRKSLIVFCISILLVGTQFYSMGKHYDNYKLSYIDSYTWYIYLGSQSQFEYSQSDIDISKNRYEEIGKIDYKEMAAISTDDMVHQLKDHPGIILKELLFNSYNNCNNCCGFIQTIYSLRSNQSLDPFFIKISHYQSKFYLSVLVLSLLFLLTRIKKLPLFIFFAASFVLYNSILSGFSFGQGDRFFIISYPLIILIVAFLINEFSSPTNFTFLKSISKRK